MLFCLSICSHQAVLFLVTLTRPRFDELSQLVLSVTVRTEYAEIDRHPAFAYGEFTSGFELTDIPLTDGPRPGLQPLERLNRVLSATGVILLLVCDAPIVLEIRPDSLIRDKVPFQSLGIDTVLFELPLGLRPVPATDFAIR